MFDLRENTEIKHFAGMKRMVKACNPINPGTPAETEEGTDGSTYTLDSSRIKKAKYFGEPMLAGVDTEAAASETDKENCCSLSGYK